MARGDQQAGRVERAVRAFLDRLRNLPEQVLSQPPADGEWSVKQLAAHSAEIYPYWAKQITWLRSHAGQPFGRTAADPARIAYVEEHKADPLENLMAEIERGAGEAAAALRAYSDEEWQRVTGIHAARGEMDMDFISTLFLAGHAEEHLKQLEETLAKVL